MASVACKYAKKTADYSTPVKDVVPRTEGLVKTAAAKTSINAPRPLDHGALELTPVRCFQWPMHLQLKNISNFTDFEIENMSKRNSPSSSPELVGCPSKGSLKKKVRWSPCAEVYEVRKLGENGRLE